MITKIHTRTIPSTGENIGVIGLGTWQTFDVASEAEMQPLKDVLKILVQHGGSVVDTSPMYGQSEQVLGELATILGLRERLFLATKIWTTGKDNGIRQMKDSLSLMKRKTIDLIQVHNLTDWATHLNTLRDWKERGIIRYIGVTHYAEAAYDELEKIIVENPLDFVQINYSLISRKAEQRIFPIAMEKKLAVLINRPFEEGALFTKVRGMAVPSWAADIGCETWAQFFLKYILSHPAVTCVIPGTSKPHHMLDNLHAGKGNLPDDNIRKKMTEAVSG